VSPISTANSSGEYTEEEEATASEFILSCIPLTRRENEIVRERDGSREGDEEYHSLLRNNSVKRNKSGKEKTIPT